MTPGENMFIDTNILLIATDESRHGHWLAREFLERAADDGCRPAISGQIVREYLVVATRPLAANGLGLSPVDALHNIRQFRSRSTFCDEPEAVSECLSELVRRHDLKGKRIHDANLVATMITHGIAVLLTTNGDDFGVFPDLTVLTLADLATR